MFIVIDGIDGSGKWTQVQLLQKFFETQGKTVKIVDYPRYANPSAFFVEKYLNGSYGKEVSPELASLFYALDRFDSAKDLLQDIKNYDFVISNRYVSASMIHQAWKIENIEDVNRYLDWLYHLEYEICKIPLPDKIIFLDVPPEISQRLITKKENRSYIQDGSNKDIHESDENHLKNAYNRALYVAEKFGWTRIECTKDGQIFPIEDITQMIIQKIAF